MNCTVSVIIPALNESANIAAAVETARAAGVEQVIVSDGGSQDDTVEIAEKYGAQVVLSNPGRAIQQNAGAAEARGEILLFLHADCQLPADAVKQIGEVIADGQTSFGAFQQKIDAPGWPYRWLSSGNAARLRYLGLAYGDQGIFVKRELFQHVGGFPAEPLMEEVVLMKRLRKNGRPALLAGPLKVHARRWQSRGIVTQTLRNWCLLAAFQLGVSPRKLAQFYPRHDTDSNSSH